MLRTDRLQPASAHDGLICVKVWQFGYARLRTCRNSLWQHVESKIKSRLCSVLVKRPCIATSQQVLSDAVSICRQYEASQEVVDYKATGPGRYLIRSSRRSEDTIRESSVALAVLGCADGVQCVRCSHVSPCGRQTLREVLSVHGLATPRPCYGLYDRVRFCESSPPLTQASGLCWRGLRRYSCFFRHSWATAVYDSPTWYSSAFL